MKKKLVLITLMAGLFSLQSFAQERKTTAKEQKMDIALAEATIKQDAILLEMYTSTIKEVKAKTLDEAQLKQLLNNAIADKKLNRGTRKAALYALYGADYTNYANLINK